MASAPRSLTLTEELERIEQAITISLQEIDYNFSKAHRIVTTTILPLVERYGEQSAAVWEASKFWKQFFESSANVSLSGYEELANGGANESTTDSIFKDETGETDVDSESRGAGDYSAASGKYEDETSEHRLDDTRSLMQADDSLLDNGEVSGSTPRMPRVTGKSPRPQFPSHESPYETLKREMRLEEQGDMSEMADEDDDDEEDDSTILFEQRTARLRDITTMTPNATRTAMGVGTPSGFGGDPQSTRRAKDPLLHRVLDKTYRIHATHHKPPPQAARLSPVKADKTPAARHAWQESPMSSPEMAVPTFRSEAFLSPLRTHANAARGKLLASARKEARTPGISVQTPMAARKTKDLFGAGAGTGAGKERGRARGEEREQTTQATTASKYEIDWGNDDSDGDDLYAGMSPPKTINFAFPPSKLVQTPAKEASRRYVESLLYTAGAEPEDMDSEQTPSAVTMHEDLLEDSF